MPAASEARSLLRLIETGAATIKDVRDFIQMSAQDERLLRGFAKSDPAVRHWVTLGLSFRRAVMREFNRLVAEFLRCEVNAVT